MPEGKDKALDFHPSTVDEILAITACPVVCINQGSFFTYINKAFEDTYGCTSEELLGKSVTTIMPEHMRNAHLVGISHFLVTEQPRVLQTPLPLHVLCKSGEVKDMELYIVGEKSKREWRFAATIKPRKT